MNNKIYSNEDYGILVNGDDVEYNYFIGNEIFDPYQNYQIYLNAADNNVFRSNFRVFI